MKRELQFPTWLSCNKIKSVYCQQTCLSVVLSQNVIQIKINFVMDIRNAHMILLFEQKHEQECINNIIYIILNTYRYFEYSTIIDFATLAK